MVLNAPQVVHKPERLRASITLIDEMRRAACECRQLRVGNICTVYGSLKGRGMGALNRKILKE